MARAITRFWSGDYEGAMVSAAIRVEAGARSLALALDKPAYRTSRADVPGMYVGLPVLMDLLDKHGLDPDWRRFLHTYFVSPAGRHLRHDVAHGFELDVATHRVDAALSIRALGLFVYLVPEPGAAGRCNGHDAALLGPTVTEAITLAYRRARSGISLVELLRAERAALHHARSGTTRLSWRR